MLSLHHPTDRQLAAPKIGEIEASGASFAEAKTLSARLQVLVGRFLESNLPAVRQYGIELRKGLFLSQRDLLFLSRRIQSYLEEGKLLQPVPHVVQIMGALIALGGDSLWYLQKGTNGATTFDAGVLLNGLGLPNRRPAQGSEPRLLPEKEYLTFLDGQAPGAKLAESGGIALRALSRLLQKVGPESMGVYSLEAGFFVPLYNIPGLVDRLGGSLIKEERRILKSSGQIIKGLEYWGGDRLFYRWQASADSRMGKAEVGWLLPFKTALSDRNGVTLDPCLHDCSKKLLCCDPLFQDRPDLRLLADPDYVAEITSSHGTYLLTKHAFTRFVQRARISSELQELYKTEFVNLRDALLVVDGMLRSSREVERRNDIRQLMKYPKKASYRLSAGWVFVVEPDSGKSPIKTCYDKGDPLGSGLYRLKS